MTAPRCVRCGVPLWFGRLLVYGDAAWAVDRLADLGLPADRAYRAIIDQGTSTMTVRGEAVAAFNPKEVNRWQLVLCIDCWPEGDLWADVTDQLRRDTIELTRLTQDVGP